MKKTILIILFIFVLRISFSNSMIKPTKLEESDFIIDINKYKGLPYKWGSINLKKGLDCSALITLIFKDNNINIRRGSYNQKKDTFMFKNKLIFFDLKGTESVNHVAIKTKYGLFHSTVSKGVTLDSIGTKRYKYFMEHKYKLF